MRDEGVTETVGVALRPVPLSETVWVLPDALSVSEIVAVLAPAAAGMKDEVSVQLAPAARLTGQVLVRVKSLPLVPPKAIVVMINGTRVLVFLTVTV